MTKSKKSIMGLFIMTLSIGGLTGFSKTSMDSPMMCVAECYINAERYEYWTEGEKAARDVTAVFIGAGIGALCPPLGIVYGL